MPKSALTSGEDKQGGQQINSYWLLILVANSAALNALFDNITFVSALEYYINISRIEGGLFPITVPVVEDCPRCSKTGFWEAFFCPACYGYGRIRAERAFSVSIPPHVKHGTEIRLSMEDIGLRDAWVNIVVYVDESLEEGTR
jgi:hypothetical protein